MDASEFSRQMLRHFEGRRPRVYPCSQNRLSIGFGFNLEDNDMPLEVAELWLSILEAEATEQVIGLFGLHFFNAIEGARKAALVNLMYNMGIGSFMRFPNMIRAIRALDWQTAAHELVTSSAGTGPSKYVRDVGERRAFFYRDLLLTGEFVDTPE